MHPHYIVPMFSLQWYLGALLSFMLFYALIQIGKYALANGFELKYRLFLAGIFLIREIYLFAYIADKGMFTLQDSLPLHLCGISYMSMIVFLIRPNLFIFEFLLLLSLGGALQSIITPELTHGYSTYFIIDYYFSHAGIIFVPMYALFVLKLRPRKEAWWKIWVLAHVILGSVYLLNLLLDSNYIYLMRAPLVNNPLILHPYPMHLLGFEIFGTLHILLLFWLSRNVLPKPHFMNTNPL
ncbi:MAG: TIGR02206 family membrane protein [Saprospiraceae bacterium]|nr:TIGR02206 family membrane protein [Saprospiraceae bacterium]